MDTLASCSYEVRTISRVTKKQGKDTQSGMSAELMDGFSDEHEHAFWLLASRQQTDAIPSESSDLSSKSIRISSCSTACHKQDGNPYRES
jgi:hypothetical protein